MEIELKPGERLDELQRNGYRIIQDPESFLSCWKQGQRVLPLPDWRSRLRALIWREEVCS